MKVKNKNYREFLDTGQIKPIEAQHIDLALRNIKGRDVKQKRILLLLLYLTGGRPSEVLNITAKDITKDKRYIKIFVKGTKKALSRYIYVPSNNKHALELLNYSLSLFPDIYLLYALRGAYTRKCYSKKRGNYTRIEISNKLRYYFKSWFRGVIEDGITPYYLRHNFFSKLAMKDVSLEDIRMLKGGKSMNSVVAYIHMSSKKAKSIAKKIN